MAACDDHVACSIVEKILHEAFSPRRYSSSRMDGRVTAGCVRTLLARKNRPMSPEWISTTLHVVFLALLALIGDIVVRPAS